MPIGMGPAASPVSCRDVPRLRTGARHRTGSVTIDAPMTHDLPAVFRRMVDLWNGRGVDPHDVYATVPEDLVPTIARYRAAFPDLRWEIDEWFAAGERYVLRMHATGTHGAEPVRFEGIELHTIRNELIVASDQVWDMGPLYGVVNLGAAD